MIAGLNLPNFSRLGHREAMIAVAQRAEELGFSSLWSGDHILLPTSMPEPYGNLLESFTTLSHLAAITEHIRLATGILVLPQRDPLLVAKQAATVHHLSGGRLVLGVGVGYVKQEYAYLRADFGMRGRLADEYVLALRALFESAAPEFHGEHINFSDVLFSPRPTVQIPIVVGGNSQAALRRAATLGDGWHGLRLSPDGARAALAVMDRYGHKEDFTVSLRLWTRVGGTIDGVERASALHGDVGAIIEQIHGYADVGVHQVVIEPFSNDLQDFLEQLQRFADEIAPALPTQ